MRLARGRDIPYKVLQYDVLPIVGVELGHLSSLREDDANLVRLLGEATGGRQPQITRSRLLVDHGAG